MYVLVSYCTCTMFIECAALPFVQCINETKCGAHEVHGSLYTCMYIVHVHVAINMRTHVLYLIKNVSFH